MLLLIRWFRALFIQPLNILDLRIQFFHTSVWFLQQTHTEAEVHPYTRPIFFLSSGTDRIFTENATNAHLNGATKRANRYIHPLKCE